MLSVSCTSTCGILKGKKNVLAKCIHFGAYISRWQTTAAGVTGAVNQMDVGGGPSQDELEEGPARVYRHRVLNGELRFDENQQIVVNHLQELSSKLEHYILVRSYNNHSVLLNWSSKVKNWFDAPLVSQKKQDEAKKYTISPLGLYLYGGVGCGKTMLMDLFHDACPILHKKRIHFHAFMLDVHQRIHEVKMSMGAKDFNLNRSQPYDPILPVARDISDEASLLCFDEFQVTDIADAMILKRLFSHMWRHGVVIVATSNRRPDDLYKNGLQRVNFLPFIPMLKLNCKIVNLNSIDYRRQSAPVEGNTYFAADRCDTKYEMDRMYEELVSREVGIETSRHLEVYGRTLTFEKTCGRILDVTFSQLCMKPLGASDYLEICRNFDIILLRDIPQISLDQRAAARRFITLIDTVYDQKVRVVFSAACVPEELFNTQVDTSEYDRHHARVLIGDLNIQVGDSNEKASLFTGEEELFAFERAVSRITDMRSASYWNMSAEHCKQRLLTTTTT